MPLLRALATSAALVRISRLSFGKRASSTPYTKFSRASSRSKSEEQGDTPNGQGLGGGSAYMTVTQNLAHHPKDQVEEG